ncbi:ubiquinol-cytochrome c reductase iron-sulfur subunit [Chitinivorax sp. B]|uniref:ubiquinol-cytochrome c reductase iron-sulfur subunit n=1 Tax=Chitinivorax sp. B TaxID=2502235 RepID=UPI0010F7A098|nr:ubiquinol-cytochrome c reductase iron-sulfur subunit [Chitinivorax sp. B]
MSDTQVDNSKRRFLVAATGAAGAVAVGGVATPFVLTFAPSERAKAAGAPVEVDISKLESGQKINVEWRGKPVWIVSRTKEQLANLTKLDDKLADPKSEADQQPEYAKNASRAIKPEIWIAVGICTHLGCSPTHRPDLAPADLGADWLGGFYCPCHGSKFDLAGRVYKGVPAPTNLIVPPHKYLSDTRVLIGDDK